MRGATITASTGWRHIGISTHAPLAGRDHNAVDRSHNVLISTHAPLAGRDFWGRLHRGCLTNFNPRAPCGARPAPHFGGVFSKKFQPTRPLRGATNLSCGLCGKNKNFNPRAPCGARPTPTRSQCCRNGNFNPRAPCGARQNGLQIYQSWGRFQPTRPLRGATEHRVDHLVRQLDFNPRAPCGARPLLVALGVYKFVFQPTRPLRGATGWEDMQFVTDIISTHAPLAGRDAGQGGIPSLNPYFNPRAPCGARQQKCTNHYAHFCDNRQISDAFAQNAACQGILLLFDAGKPCGFWVRTAQVISAHLCFAL